MKSADISYMRVNDMFTAFFPETPSGEQVWNELAKQSEGTGRFLHTQVDGIIAQIRAAGYVVRKCKPKPMTPKQLDELEAEIADMYGVKTSTI